MGRKITCPENVGARSLRLLVRTVGNFRLKKEKREGDALKFLDVKNGGIKMKVKDLQIAAGQGRRFAYTSKGKSVFCIRLSEKEKEENGFFFVKDGVKHRVFRTFRINGLELENAERVIVRPYGFEVAKASFFATLLLHEEAFYIRSSSPFSVCGIAKDFFHAEEKLQKHGVKCAVFRTGAALCADKPFSYALLNGEELSITPLSKDEETHFYLVFDEDAKRAQKHLSCLTSKTPSASSGKENDVMKAASFDSCIKEREKDEAERTHKEDTRYEGENILEKCEAISDFKDKARTGEKEMRDAFERHKAEIDEFLEGALIDFTDENVNKALAFSRFNSWLLSVASDKEAGIWAGLPWFTDSWGRDIFISLTGALLTTGKSAEAFRVITSFASHQDIDEKSGTYGRIPNRYRGKDDVIYNTADGTLWFIRAIYEYVNYTGDENIFASFSEVIFRAIEGEARRTSEEGFLLHDDADTWMDARVDGKEAYSPRGECAVEVEALWFTALRIGFYAADFLKDEAKKARYASLAAKVKSSFLRFFTDSLSLTLADHLKKTVYSTWQCDRKVRPNAVLALFVTQVLPEGEENSLINAASARRVMEETERELYTPQGLMTLSLRDTLFHAHHETNELHHKDAAYHNGTIWPWLSGAYISVKNRVLHLDESLNEADGRVSTLLFNSVKNLLDGECVGALPENIHAFPDKNGAPISSGTYMQLWSMAEMNRVISEDILGFRSFLSSKKIIFRPAFPFYPIHVRLPFGSGSFFCIDSAFKEKENEVIVKWKASIKDAIRFKDGVLFDTDERFSLNKNGAFPPNTKEICTEERGASDESERIFPNEEKSFFIERREGGNDSASHLDKSEGFIPKSNEKQTDAGAPLYEKKKFFADENENSFAKMNENRFGESAALYGSEKISSKTNGSKVASLKYTGEYEGDFTSHLNEYPWVLSGKEKDFLKNLAIKGLLNRPHESGADYFERLPFYEKLESFYKKNAVREVKFGAECSENESSFRLFAPTANRVTLLIEHHGKETSHEMLTDEKLPGMWHLKLRGDFHACFYRYALIAEGKKIYTVDGAAKSFTANGKKSALLDFSRLSLPSLSPAPVLKNPAQAVIYEVHVRDLTSSPFWNGSRDLQATYLGAAEKGTTYNSLPTAFDYIKSLGVTHVQLLPLADFSSVDETRAKDAAYKNLPLGGAFNWGYDSENFFAPEGSYSTSPDDPVSRVRELELLIDSFNKEGIGVVMDVVFNHLYDAAKNALNLAAPGYFLRASSLSGAGADVASERFMVRKFIVSCLEFWLKEYNLAGFRFDLMGLLDVETVNEAARRLRAIKSDVLLYGEGWCMSKGEFIAADMKHASSLDEIGFFNDAFRCAVKGSVFADAEKGFIHDGRNREALKFGITGATPHPDVDFKNVTGTACPAPWSCHPWRSVNYTEVHDNLTLYAKLVLAEEGKSEAYYERMAIFALSLVLLSEGTVVLHAGMEFLRSKEVPQEMKSTIFPDAAYTANRRRAFLRNTYNVTDKINSLDWKRMSEKAHVVEYVRKLIKIKKEHPAFAVRESGTLSRVLRFEGANEEGSLDAPLVWRIDGGSVGDEWGDILLAACVKEEEVPFVLPDGEWRVICDGRAFYENKTASGEVKLASKALSVFVRR